MTQLVHHVFFAAAVLFTAACRMDVAEADAVQDPVRHISFQAGPVQTRTAFVQPDGDRYPVLWEPGDQVKLLVNGAQIGSGPDGGVFTVAPSADGRAASFGADLSETGQGNLVLDVLSPASAFREADPFSGLIKVSIPASQAASPLSADPKAMLLGAEAEPYDNVPSQVRLSFRHLTAYGKLTLTHLKGNLSSVELVSDRDLAGTFSWNAQTGALEAVSAVRSVRVAVTDPGAVWFACVPSDWSGSTLSVTATTSAGSFTQSVTFPSGRDLQAGHIALFTVDMDGAGGTSDVFDESQVVLSFGAISDTHINSASNAYATKFTNALQQLKDRAAVLDPDGLDMVVVAGDLTDQPTSTQAQIGYFKSLYEGVLDPREVPMIYTIGNHDANPSYWWTSQTIIQAAVMSQVLGSNYFLTEQPDGMRAQYECRHDRVGDYHILSLTPTGTGPVTYPAESKAWLDAMLAKLTAADPERFIIVNTHPMIENTCYGSLLGTPMGRAQSDIWDGSDNWATRDLTAILSKYPQVVTFGGHLHFPLNDPRSIWQGDFTSFGCGSTRYMAIENGKYQDMRSATVMNDCEQFSQGWLIQLDRSGNLRATPLDFYRSAVIGQPYEIPHPRADKSHLGRYGSARASANQAPVLDASRLQMNSRQIGTLTSATVEWAKAADDEFVHHYVLQVKKNGATIVSRKYLADFYLHPQPSGMKDTWSVSLGSLAAGTYEVSLTASDSWDASATVTKSFTIEGPKPVETGLYADIDFSDGTVRDSKGKLALTNKGATIAQTSVSHAGKTYSVPALHAGASKYVECQFNEIGSFDEAAAFMAAGFSVEAMFVDRAPGSAVHGVVCGTQSGGWGLAMRATGVPYFIVGENSYNSYVSVDAASAISTTDLTHVVCVYDPGTRKMLLYVNGQLSRSQSISGSFYPGASPTFNRFCLGADISLTATPDFPCSDMVITDAKWYVGALDAAAVQAAYTASVNNLKQ
ncbi:MAG: metallophosphoesterase [Bacteroidales bacterium]|nr:metallophosphoesterase [Bacteroidales bacterium]